MRQKHHVTTVISPYNSHIPRHKNTSPPRLDGRKPRYSNYYRRPKTLNTLRQLCWNDTSEGEPFFRGGKKSVPTSWDDVIKSTLRAKSWKRYRKTQRLHCSVSFRNLSALWGADHV